MADGRIVIVTGAAQGIGLAIAQGFVAEGDTVVGSDIDADGLASAADTLNASGPGRFIAQAADMGDLDAITALVDGVVADHGWLDVLVNNAGVTRRADILELTEADFDRIIRVNQKGVFFCMQAAARQMARLGNGGRIISIASVGASGYRGTSNVIYASTKGAVVAMSKLAASQLARHDITVNTVSPGITDTAIIRGIMERDAETKGISLDEAYATAVADVPLARPNTPEDIAAMVVFLASPGARNITGCDHTVDGGLML
jgi:NAD(P)-dependent dehydrogenase (short-subunit alcohol dehydrogenase family)